MGGVGPRGPHHQDQGAVPSQYNMQSTTVVIAFPSLRTIRQNTENASWSPTTHMHVTIITGGLPTNGPVYSANIQMELCVFGGQSWPSALVTVSGHLRPLSHAHSPSPPLPSPSLPFPSLPGPSLRSGVAVWPRAGPPLETCCYFVCPLGK